MKTIGLIGGMSWQSSKIYYEYFNQLVSERLGGSHSAKILLSSLDFAEIEKLTFEDNWNAIGNLMAVHAKKLRDGGADVLLIGSNTINSASSYVTQAVKLPFIHIAQATGQAITKKGLKKVALLGTKFTMEKDFYSKVLENDFGLEVITPDKPEREVLQTIIYNELVKGIFKPTSKEKILKIVKKLEEKGVEGVILGCTELPILITPEDIDLPSFDTTLLHSQMAVDFALN